MNTYRITVSYYDAKDLGVLSGEKDEGIRSSDIFGAENISKVDRRKQK